MGNVVTLCKACNVKKKNKVYNEFFLDSIYGVVSSRNEEVGVSGNDRYYDNRQASVLEWKYIRTLDTRTKIRLCGDVLIRKSESNYVIYNCRVIDGEETCDYCIGKRREKITKRILDRLYSTGQRGLFACYIYDDDDLRRFRDNCYYQEAELMAIPLDSETKLVVSNKMIKGTTCMDIQELETIITNISSVNVDNRISGKLGT